MLVAGPVVGVGSAWAQQALDAEETREERTPQLSTVTVIGTGLPTEVMRNPASITVITAEDIEEKAAVSVAELLRDVPGVQISEEGIERITIRGEESRRVAILIDGQKLTDHTNYGQPVLVDPTTIERIDVLRGASSVVSGSAAIGGVINIITKRGAAKPFALSATAGYMSATRGYRVSVAASGTVDSGPGALDYNLSAGRMEQGDRRVPGGDRLQPSNIDDRNLSGHLGYRLGQHYFGVKHQRYDLAANVYVVPPAGVDAFSIKLPHRDLRKTSLFYEGSELAPWLTKLSANAHRQTIDRDFSNDVRVTVLPVLSTHVQSDSLDEQTTSGFDIRAEMKFSGKTRTVVGVEREEDALKANKNTITTTTRYIPPPGSTTTTITPRFDDARTKTWSVFGQHELALTDELTATIGARRYQVRADHRRSIIAGLAQPTTKASDDLWLGSAGLVWSPSNQLSLRANLAQGYIYPTLAQLFLTTTAGTTRGSIIGNPNLEPERSTTFELGSRYSANGAMIDATLFYSSSKDYIATVELNATTSTYQNVDEAISWGLELYAEQATAFWNLTPYTSFAAMRRQLRYGNGFNTYDSGSPVFSGKIGVRKDWTLARASGSVDLYLRGESQVRMRNELDVAEEGASGYGTLNLRANAHLSHDWTLVAELNNLTDRHYRSYQEMPGAARSINLFLTKKL